ncbi:glutamyl-tRNA amidotransferase [Haladaptatus sp. R4]|uniref:amidase n=1 Tax=Haladaptatus sp. R4 TaxID=1679489 RepID=UPI0007B46C13|nr:amidase [Haladaptatus sp. R4]KZN22621.1 glutamyl-tRNA amidotransferase [Haladaptatus sp. R4]
MSEGVNPSASELATCIRRGSLSIPDVTEKYLTRLEKRDGDLNAFVTVLEEEARERAQTAEAELTNGAKLGPLHGVPIAIKDLFDFKTGAPNTFGSKPFEDFVPEQNATYVDRLLEAGAIIVGKTNTPEFGHKGVTDNLVIGPTSTPFDLNHNAGGSSGGSAAAVAAGIVPLAQGGDSGGSIRIPASCCGVYGFNPTYRRVAQEIRPDAFLSHTPFLQIGPISRTVEDAALMLDVMTGPHPRDPLSMPDDGADFVTATRQSISGLKIAYSPDLDVFPIDTRVQSVVDEAVRAFETAGATVEEVKIGIEQSHRELADLWIRQNWMTYHSTLEGFKSDGIDLLGDYREDLTPALVDHLEDTADLSIREYKRDEHARTQVYDAIQDVFEEYDLIVTPTIAVPPVKNHTGSDEQTVGPTEINGESVDPLIGWCLTFPFNFTGHPAASIPAGLSDGLPIGMQIVGDRFADETVFAASGAFERIKPWADTYSMIDC